MIKVNELRIGNLIMEAGEQSNVYMIDRGGISFYRINDIPVNKETGCTLNGGEDRFNPIPISPEWLKRCGFKWDNGYLKISLKYAKLRLGFYAGVSDKMSMFQTGLPGEGSPVTEIGFGENHPDHLHQLQNLYYALTGEELSITL